MTLNINSKTLFLTYSQVNQDGIDRFVSTPSDHFDFVSSSLGTPTRYRLARESHQDGGHHFHAYLGFESAVRIRSASRLDFGQHHPNIQSVRTGHRRTWDYVGKDGDIVYEIGDPPDPIGGPSGAAATLYGLRLYAQNLKKNFIRSCETELRDIISYITDNSNNTPRSSMEFVHNHTNRQPYGPYWTENCRMEEPGDYRRQRRRTQTEKSNPLGSDEDW